MKKNLFKLFALLLVCFGLEALPVKAADCTSGQEEKNVYYFFADVNSSTGEFITGLKADVATTTYTSATKYNNIPSGAIYKERKVIDLYRTSGTGWSLTTYWDNFKTLSKNKDGNYSYTIAATGTTPETTYVWHTSYKLYASASDLANDTNGTANNNSSLVFDNAATSALVDASVLPTTTIGVPSQIATPNAMDGTYSTLRWTATRNYLSGDITGRTAISLTDASGQNGKTVYYAPALYYVSYCVAKTSTSTDKWKLIYNAGDYDVTVPATTTEDCGTSQTVSSTKPTLSGKTFKGWTTTKGGTTVNYASGATVASSTTDCKDVTLYPVFVDNNTTDAKWTITYDANGKNMSMPASTTAACGVSQKVTTTVPKLDGYTFTGWAIASDKTKVVYKANDVITSSKNACTDLTLYAVMVENPKTGESNAIWILMGIIALSGTGYYFIKKKDLFKMNI